MEMYTLFPLSCLIVIQSIASQSTILHRQYVRCPISSATIGQGPDTMIGRSVLQCAARCAAREWCQGVTICPGGGGHRQVICRMENDVSLEQCEQEDTPGHCHLVYRVKNARITTEETSVTTGGTPLTTQQALVTTEGTTVTTQETSVTTQETSVTTQETSVTTQETSVTTQETSVTTQETSVTTQETSVTTQETSVTTQETSVTTQETSVTTQETSVTTEMVCQNGGTLTGNTCICPSPFVGTTCQRYMRDCSEGREAGHSMTQGVYSIQPQGVATPFKVKCSDEITFGFWRMASSSAVPWTSMSWDDAKHGVGDDLSVLNSASNPENFFLGLIKLRQIVSQAQYSNHVFFMYDSWSKFGSPNYNNFTLGPESSDFQLSYGDFNFLGDNEADNGLDANDPIVFSTADHDTNGCAGTKGAPGWYGTGCHGYSVFADPPLWPVGGADKQADVIVMNLQRMSDFYDD